MHHIKRYIAENNMRNIIAEKLCKLTLHSLENKTKYRLLQTLKSNPPPSSATNKNQIQNRPIVRGRISYSLKAQVHISIQLGIWKFKIPYGSHSPVAQNSNWFITTPPHNFIPFIFAVCVCVYIYLFRDMLVYSRFV